MTGDGDNRQVHAHLYMCAHMHAHASHVCSHTQGRGDLIFKQPRESPSGVLNTGCV